MFHDFFKDLRVLLEVNDSPLSQAFGTEGGVCLEDFFMSPGQFFLLL